MEALGSGAIAHCVIQFSTQFWGETPAFGVVGSKIVAPDEIQKLANASDPERGANFLFLNLTSVYDKPTLLCLHSGQAAQAAELPSIESTMKTLKTVTGINYFGAVNNISFSLKKIKLAYNHKLNCLTI